MIILTKLETQSSGLRSEACEADELPGSERVAAHQAPSSGWHEGPCESKCNWAEGL